MIDSVTAVLILVHHASLFVSLFLFAYNFITSWRLIEASND